MRPQPRAQYDRRLAGRALKRVLRRLTLVAALAAAVILAATATTTAAPAPWQLTQRPWTDGVPVTDIAAAEPSFVAVSGAQGRVAVSLDGGATWTLRDPAASGFEADLAGISFRNLTQGVVAGAAGTLLVTSDAGYTWVVPTFSSAAPTVDLNDVALAGTRAAAVGDNGVVLESTSGGVSWRNLPRPTTADLVSVGVSEDGTIVVGASTRDVFVRRGTTWSNVELSAPATSVTIRFPLASNASPMTIVASSGYDVIGNESGGTTFTTLLSAIYASEPTWPALTWSSVPGDELLVAGPAGFASFYDVLAKTWRQGVTLLDRPVAVASTPGQSVAYVLGTDGRVARTLSSGRSGATLLPGTKTTTAGQKVTFTSTVNVAAPGEVVIERRLGGSMVWRGVRRLTWAATDWERSFEASFTPTFTTEYRLRFVYGGVGPLVSSTARVTVGPKLTPDKLRIVVSRGQAYRFKGSVFPTLRGEKVRLFTDRGGKWHQIDVGGVVKLRDGKRWVSRLFGTPVRETYRLKARVLATTKHGASWSPVVTVVVR